MLKNIDFYIYTSRSKGNQWLYMLIGNIAGGGIYVYYVM